MAPTKVMVNGLPGRVAEVVARQVLKHPAYELIPWSLTGPEIDLAEHVLADRKVELIRPQDRQERMTDIIAREDAFISVDFTHPTAVNDNAAFYCRRHLPFVMGTTGGDREKLEQTVAASDIPAVIAPNMVKQIVGFQAMMAYAADTFPGLFKGYNLTVRESHQEGKADTSGTAKAVVASFNRLGLDFSPEEIEKIRDPRVQQEEWGVPREHLEGHGWHTYGLLSEDGTVRFEFTHNVNGREVYALGTIDAIAFLQAKIAQGAGGAVFTMIDVLKAG